jgi:hypothetical protein
MKNKLSHKQWRQVKTLDWVLLAVKDPFWNGTRKHLHRIVKQLTREVVAGSTPKEIDEALDIPVWMALSLAAGDNPEPGDIWAEKANPRKRYIVLAVNGNLTVTFGKSGSNDTQTLPWFKGNFKKVGKVEPMQRAETCERTDNGN